MYLQLLHVTLSSIVIVQCLTRLACWPLVEVPGLYRIHQMSEHGCACICVSLSSSA